MCEEIFLRNVCSFLLMFAALRPRMQQSE